MQTSPPPPPPFSPLPRRDNYYEMLPTTGLQSDERAPAYTPARLFLCSIESTILIRLLDTNSIGILLQFVPKHFSLPFLATITLDESGGRSIQRVFYIGILIGLETRKSNREEEAVNR